MGKIFISYRREDAQGEAGHLLSDLRRRFGQDRVFLDVAAIRPGEDFRKAVEEAVGSCTVLLALIGKKWSTAADSSGRRRLDDPRDFVRFETAVALRRDVRVIPVLVQGAAMPKEEELPDELKALVWRNALELSHSRWDYDIQQLLGAIELAAQADNATAKRNTGPTSVSDPAADKPAPEAEPLLANAVGKTAHADHTRVVKRGKRPVAVAAGVGLLALGMFGWSTLPNHSGIDHDGSVARTPGGSTVTTAAQPGSPVNVVSPSDQIATEKSSAPSLPHLIERETPALKIADLVGYGAGFEQNGPAAPKIGLFGTLDAGDSELQQAIKRRCQHRAEKNEHLKCEINELSKQQKELSERLEGMDRAAKGAIRHIRAG